MMPLCFFMALVTVAIASPVNDDGHVYKLFFPTFLGATSGGFLGTYEDVIKDLEDQIQQFITPLIDQLEEKSSEDGYYEVFEELDQKQESQLCFDCNNLEEREYINACNNFCSRQGYRPSRNG